jgi:AcrR family transcriptional regulator
MTKPVKSRPYHAPRRRAAAAQTRRAILDAATRLFAAHGYSAVTMATIAVEAGVATDTVYAAIGPKPMLFRLLIERAISGEDEPVTAEERDYVRAIRAEPDARQKLAIYARAIRHIQARLAPLFLALQAAASSEPELAALWAEIGERRATNMRRLATELAETGSLRPDVSVEEVADVIWTMNAAEFYVLLVRQRGWAPERYEEWLADAWQRLLLIDQAAH